MRNVLPNGVILEGTIAQLNAVRTSLGYEPLFIADGNHYNSSSRGVVRISDMDTQHIKNAIRKHLTTAISALDTRGNDRDFLSAVANVLKDVTVVGLFNELTIRIARGR